MNKDLFKFKIGDLVKFKVNGGKSKLIFIILNTKFFPNSKFSVYEPHYHIKNGKWNGWVEEKEIERVY